MDFVPCVRCGSRNERGSTHCSQCRAVIPRFADTDEQHVRNIGYAGIDGLTSDATERPDIIAGLRSLEGYVRDGSISLEEYIERIDGLTQSVSVRVEGFLKEEGAFQEATRKQFTTDLKRALLPTEERLMARFAAERKARLSQVTILFRKAFEKFSQFAEYLDLLFIEQGIEFADEAQSILYSLDELTDSIVEQLLELDPAVAAGGAG